MSEKPAPSYRALSQKYRPQLFSQVCHQAPIIETMKNALSQERLGHAYLFSGTRGTGKTSLARLFAKAINCTNKTSDTEPCNQCPSCQEMLKGSCLDFLEMDAASNRGIDDIRALLETVAYKPSLLAKKIYLIDEVHMLTKEAFNALLKTLEEPPSHVLFFLATTERHKLPATIISRCQRFELGKIPVHVIEKKLTSILNDFSISAQDEALKLIAVHAEGSLRDAESILDQMLCLCQDNLTKEGVELALGLPQEMLFFQIDYAVAQDDLAFPFSFVETMYEKGVHLSHFLSSLAMHYRSLCKQALLKNNTYEKPATLTLPTTLDQALTLYSQNHLFDCLDLVTKKCASFTENTLTPMDIEVLLLEIIRSKNRRSNSFLVEQILLLKKDVTFGKKSLDSPQKLPPKLPPKPAATPAINMPKPFSQLTLETHDNPNIIATVATVSPKAAPEKPKQPEKTTSPAQVQPKQPKKPLQTQESKDPSKIMDIEKKVLQEQKLWFAAVELGGNLSKE
ncbi:DNA polymerase III subunit gamma/tau [Candidatus Aerophobetes bacterium]|uniref:DNA polymerase III subunit gamma/tau n=1 Tax=Aerophobetes bacterium TaxID=2030807 RepID=A0A2A4X5U7_UNCAE|nr:MAG: DNA polymerase III subunit gamma/tau [Candidatus Aerophobetes bacterium]